MTDSRVSRRAALQTLAVGVVTSAVAKAAGPDAGLPAPVTGMGAHTVVPLPFPAGRLTGLSEKLITSHHDNNYAAAVKNLNKVEVELSHLTADAPGFLVAGLREKELTFRNSKTLHEAYFGNLGGDGKRSGAIEHALASSFGSSGGFEASFRAAGLALGGGSGWVVLCLELDTGALRTVASTGHPQALANAAPLLVLDMYEHSYQLDYGAAHAKYVDAFFANVSWDEVNRRLERAQKASAAWRA